MDILPYPLIANYFISEIMRFPHIIPHMIMRLATTLKSVIQNVDYTLKVMVEFPHLHKGRIAGPISTALMISSRTLSNIAAFTKKCSKVWLTYMFYQTTTCPT